MEIVLLSGALAASPIHDPRKYPHITLPFTVGL